MLTIYNPSPNRLTRWVDVAVDPVTDAKLPAAYCGSTSEYLSEVVRGPAIGDHGRIWHLRADVPGRTQVRVGLGELVALADAPPPFQLGLNVPPPGWSPISVVLRIRGGSPVALVPRLVSITGDHRRTLHMRDHSGGFHADLWIHVYSNSSVVDWSLQLLWSDSQKEDVSIEMESIAMMFAVSGYLHYLGRSFHGGDVVSLAENFRWPDALGIPVRGTMSFTPAQSKDANESEVTDVSYDSGEGQLVAHCSGFRDNACWLAFGAAGEDMGMRWPKLNESSVRSVLQPRPLANAGSTGSTGSQPPFGATKYPPDAMALYDVIWSADDYILRGLHNRETNGTRVLHSSHPQWETYNGVTERNSVDRLGKVKDRPWGWSSVAGRDAHVDDQHRGDAFLLAAYAMTGDPMLRECMLDMLEVDTARAKRKRNSLDAPRASGRLWQSWAKMVPLLPDRRNVLSDLAEHELRMNENRLLQQPGPCRWLTVYNRDGRVLDPAVAPLSCAPWNEALAVLGAYEQHFAWARHAKELSERFRQFALEHGERILRWGYVLGSDGVWRCITGLMVRGDGQPNPDSYYAYPRPGAGTSVQAGTDMMVASGGWHYWYIGAIAAVLRWSQDSALVDRAKAIRGMLRPADAFSQDWLMLPI